MQQSMVVPQTEMLIFSIVTIIDKEFNYHLLVIARTLRSCMLPVLL